jgi:hypothetical protein
MIFLGPLFGGLTALTDGLFGLMTYLDMANLCLQKNSGIDRERRFSSCANGHLAARFKKRR